MRRIRNNNMEVARELAKLAGNAAINLFIGVLSILAIGGILLALVSLAFYIFL